MVVFYCTSFQILNFLVILNYFQVKLILEMLVKKCGLDAVKAVMPEEHMKLLTNIRKVCLNTQYKNDNCMGLFVKGICEDANAYYIMPWIQIRERKERNMATSSEEARSHVSKATTSRY